jgi:4-amino-4-deoxy-L-arabinose transferase-like glycosyltransferase
LTNPGLARNCLVRWLKERSGFLAVIAAWLILYSILPLDSALQLGGDEGYELMKGVLHAKRYSLYTQIWNDQPPVFTILLSAAFRLFGTTAFVARTVAAGFGLLLFLSLFRVVARRSGAWPGLLTIFLLISSPLVLRLSFSVMLEVPAFAAALTSAYFIFVWRDRRHYGWLLASGVLTGIALGIKLTAILVVPAILLEILLQYRTGALKARLQQILLDLGRWGFSAFGSLILINVLWARGSYQSSLKSHFTTAYVAGLSLPTDFRFSPAIFLDHPECLIAAVMALVFALRQRRLKEIAFPLTFLATALFIHAFHTPWWNYYYLHFAIPLAWLAGFALFEAVRTVGRLFSARKVQIRSATTLKAVSLSVLVALALAVAEARLEGNIKAARNTPKASESPVLAKMKQLASRTHWAYAQPVIYPFQAGLLVPPELAVVMLKRFWSGQITTEQIVETCQRYKPEQILLFTARASGPWEPFLKANYSPVFQDQELTLYVSNSILQRESP